MPTFFQRLHMPLLSDGGLLRRYARKSHRWQIIFSFLGVAFIIILAAAQDWPPPVHTVDVEQTRLNVALPPLPAGEPFVQSFRPEHNGLVEIELLLARLTEGAAGTVTLRLHDEAGQLVAAESWPAGSLEHNQALALHFRPQPTSAGQRYELSLQGTRQFPFSFWAYNMDVYADGALTTPDARAQDLRFVTQYQLLPPDAVKSVASDLRQDGGVLLLALTLLLMPGALLLLVTEQEWPRQDGVLWWGVALALGVAAWPLLWYWLSLAGGRWRGWSLAAVLAGGWLAILIIRRRKGGRMPHNFTLGDLPLVALLGVALIVRLLAVRDLSFPPWVDPSRHALITQVMATSGQIVRDYQPFLPVERFPYHFGFHTLPAGLTLLGRLELPSLLLKVGQLLNALVAVTVYGAAALVTRRRGPALIAALLVALPFYFPAYYASWGRFTQLTGVLLLPILLALTWLAMEKPGAHRRRWLLVAVLAAGLALIHFRVFLIYLPFAAIAWLVASRGRALGTLVMSGLMALLLAGPRLWELYQMARAMGTGILTGAPATYNQFPWGYVVVGWERMLLAAAGVALLLTIAPALRGRSWALFALALASWSSIVFLILSYAPASWLINLNSAYIVLFVPLALILGLAGGMLEAWWREHGGWSAPAYALAGILLAALILFGLRQQIDILNPVTQLARPVDAAGIAWVEENVPADATVAVNSWRWLGGTWAGSDGGAWLLPLTGRMTTTPPADYVYSKEMVHEVAAFNEVAQAIEDWSDPEAARWLQEKGVTHIFVGQRGGYFDPAELADNPLLATLYNHDGVFVFAVEPIMNGNW